MSSAVGADLSVSLGTCPETDFPWYINSEVAPMVALPRAEWARHGVKRGRSPGRSKVRVR